MNKIYKTKWYKYNSMEMRVMPLYLAGLQIFLDLGLWSVFFVVIVLQDFSFLEVLILYLTYIYENCATLKYFYDGVTCKTGANN